MNKVLIDVFNELNEKGINYVVLRGYESLPYEIEHDIDFAVQKDHLSEMVNIIINVVKNYNYKKVFESYRQGFYQLYLYSVDNGSCVKFDVWTKFTYKGLEYIKIEDVLRETKVYNGIIVSKENMELLISFIKEFLHNGRIRKDKYTLLKEKLEKYGFINLKHNFINEKDIQKFVQYLENKQLVLSKEKKKFVVRLFWRNFQINGFYSTFYSVFNYLYKFLKDKIRKKSFFIVLIGPDGSGKTTLSKLLIEEIKERKSCFSNFYYIHGRFGISPNLSSVLGNKEDTKKMKFDLIKKKNKIKQYSKFRIFIYMFYYFFDYFFGYFILFPKKFSRTLIVADRYFYDYFYQSTFRKYPKVFRYFYFLLPKPDLLIYLKANPSDIYKRKSELSIQLLTEQQENIEKMLTFKYLYKNYILINTSKNIEETFKEIKKAVYT